MPRADGDEDGPRAVEPRLDPLRPIGVAIRQQDAGELRGGLQRLVHLARQLVGLTRLPVAQQQVETLVEIGQAVDRGKKVEALESIEQQIGFFAGLPMDQQVTFLNATVDGLPDLDKSFDLLLRHWKAGQPDKLAREMNESLEATPQLARVLLTDRNANWAQWIKARLDRPGTVFVAVGAGHLAGSGSVQDQLKALGLQVDRVKK